MFAVTLNSALLFWERLDSSLPSAVGCSSPKLIMFKRESSTPYPSRYCITILALRSPSAMLYSSVPSSQVLYPPQFVNGAFYPLSGALGSLSPPVQSPDLWFINNSELLELDSFEIYDPEYYWYALDTETYKLPKGYTAIPVPTTILLLGSGLVGLAVTRKKIKRRQRWAV